jgi:hypothetical protein
MQDGNTDGPTTLDETDSRYQTIAALFDTWNQAIQDGGKTNQGNDVCPDS